LWLILHIYIILDCSLFYENFKDRI
jgi:hypothetical protein